MRKVAIIGNFEGGKTPVGGQTAKTINIYNELSSNTDWNIKIVDVSRKADQPILLLIQSIYCLATTKDIIVLLSENGLKVYLPLLYGASIALKRKIYHDVIGGNLAFTVKENPIYKKYLNSFCVNWVETMFLKKELIQQGIQNVGVLPNFRCFQPLEVKDLIYENSEPFKFCTFSRIAKEKGIEDAIEAIQEVNRKYGRQICGLSIYGSIDKDYEKRFQTVMEDADACIKYCGCVSFDQAVQTISKFYATLFPTYWIGESNAGTVTESFFAGVPVVATDWRCNSEMITNGYNGLIYPSDTIKTLVDAIIWMIENKEKVNGMKKNCLESAKSYCADNCIKQVISFIEKNG